MSPKLLNILLLLIPITLYFGYISPFYTGEEGLVWTPERSLPSLQAENVQYINTLQQMELIKSKAKELNDNYRSFSQEDKTKIFTMLPDTVDPVKLQNEVIVIAARSGVALNGVKVEKDLKGDKGLNFYKVNFSVRTKYSTFKTLMENYEKNKRVFILESATIARPKLDQSQRERVQIPEDMLDFNVVFRVYYVLDK